MNRLAKYFRAWLFFVAALSLLSCSSAVQLPKLSPEAVILAFGDSLTYGIGVTRDQSYPAVLAALTGHKVINAGVPGEISAAGLARLPALLDDAQPELIIICHAGNDMLRGMSLAQAETNLRAMVSLARQRGIAVIIVGVPKFSIVLSSAAFYNTLAQDMKIPIEADILPAVLGKRRLKSDQIHPNSAGYRLIAQALVDLMHKTGAL